MRNCLCHTYCLVCIFRGVILSSVDCLIMGLTKELLNLGFRLEVIRPVFCVDVDEVIHSTHDMKLGLRDIFMKSQTTVSLTSLRHLER